jgi:hypothetical protein
MITSGRRPFKTRADATPLLQAEALRPDWQDCQRVHVGPTATHDPEKWAEAIFHNPPKWVAMSLRLRDRVVSLFGLEIEETGNFPVIRRDVREVLVGNDDKHLNFRASVHRTDGAVDVVTIVETHNLLGRLYLLPVRLVHGPMVRRMLRRAAHNLDRDLKVKGRR